MKRFIPILIYLTGVVAAYYVGKNHIIHFNESLQRDYPTVKTAKYTLGNKTFVMAFSLLSWLDVAAIGLMDGVDYLKTKVDWDKQIE